MNFSKIDFFTKTKHQGKYYYLWVSMLSSVEVTDISVIFSGYWYFTETEDNNLVSQQHTQGY